MNKSSTEITNGWARPSKSRKYHYFVDSTALCERWSFYGRSENEIPMRKRCVDCERARPAGAL